jgi:hypothetical protein
MERETVLLHTERKFMMKGKRYITFVLSTFLLTGCAGETTSQKPEPSPSSVPSETPEASVVPEEEDTIVNIIPSDDTTYRDLFKEAWESGSLAFSNGYSAGIDNGNMHAGSNDTADYEYYPLSDDASTSLYVFWDNSDSAYRACTVSPYLYTGNIRAAINVQRYQKILSLETDEHYINAEGTDVFTSALIRQLALDHGCKPQELTVYITRVDGREDLRYVTFWKPDGGSAWYDGQPWSEIKDQFPVHD